jgi:hypothetical protein
VQIGIWNREHLYSEQYKLNLLNIHHIKKKMHMKVKGMFHVVHILLTWWTNFKKFPPLHWKI